MAGSNSPPCIGSSLHCRASRPTAESTVRHDTPGSDGPRGRDDQCENALATHRHLPGLLALLDCLEGRRQAMDAAEWWRRHGQAWVALTEGILPKFTRAEVAQ